MKLVFKVLFSLLMAFAVTSSVMAQEKKVSFFIIKTAADRDAGFSEGAAISKESGLVLVLHYSQKYGWELMAPYGNDTEKNLIVSKLANKYKLNDSKENESFYNNSLVAVFRKGETTDLTKKAQPANPQPQAASVNLIDTKNKATIMGSCAGIASALQMATNKISMEIRSRPAQNGDQVWQNNKDADEVDRLGKSGSYYSKPDYNAVPPSQVGDINTALIAAMGKAQQLSSTHDGAVKVIQTFEKCRGF